MNTTTDRPAETPTKRRNTKSNPVTAEAQTTGAQTAAAVDADDDHGHDDDTDTGDSRALAAPPRRDPRIGPVIAFTTAAVVFVIGQFLMPGGRSAPEPITVAPAAVVPPPVAPGAQPPAVTVAPATQPAEVVPPPAAAPETPPLAAAIPPAPPPAAGQPAKVNAVEKDVAREAWRKNLPDISGDARRSSLLIPIRGSIDGATYHFIEKQKGVILTLPQAESMITMPFYRLNNDSFRTLWIKQGGGEPTSIRLMLGASVIKPEVEIKEGFARVTVTKTAPAQP